jgi:hypothetical protein
MMNNLVRKAKIVTDVDKFLFENTIIPAYEPVIFKGLINNWKVVEASNQGEEFLYKYLNNLYAGGDVRFARLPAYYKGIFSYNKNMTGLNFSRHTGSFSSFFDEMVNNSKVDNSDVVAIQSAPAPDYFPLFSKENPLSLFEQNIYPRIWMGNNSIVSAHYDDANCIACVVSGKRTFTLFPPEQIENLYIGPLDFTPAGAPVSLVDFSDPDLDKYPKFSQAMDHAIVAELEVGDAIYIPPLWWHHVQASGGVNMLVNYWQGGTIAGGDKPFPADCILMAMMSIKDLPQTEKKAWKAFFDYYIFSEQKEKYDHIPAHVQGLLAKLNKEQRLSISSWLISQLK